ncbi:MAG: sugar phosphate isomerase/epimerase [Oscillospiraceae bacterium]|nr:sugar phosphate isomerase/epimerase [Oscillospiraceae bacterium]
MEPKIIISGFADEIDPQLDVQLKVVKDLGMEYICFRAADGKGVAEYTLEEVKEVIKPRLDAAGVKVSSLGSPIGKINIDDEEAYAKQLEQLDTLCQICNELDCKYIRMFSFWMVGKNPDDWKEEVLKKLRGYADVAAKYGVILIHENEKDIYGDIGSRCKVILDELASPNFKAAFDFANFVQCGENTAECWELLKEHVAYIHIKDAVAGKNENVVCATGDGQIPEILAKAIREDGYEGFLTLEPHLVLFATLQSLEVVDATEVISENKAKDGAEGYAMQYNALKEVLAKI